MEVYDNKKINSVLSVSKKLVDRLGDGSRDDFAVYKYLIFAGMIKYYGKEKIDDIYEVFKYISTVKVKGSIREMFDRFLCIEESILSELNENDPKIYLSPSMFDVDGDQRNIYVSDKKTSNIDLLMGLALEYNKAMNSRKKRVLGKSVRCGVRVTDERGKTEGKCFEEAVNLLQTDEIMANILGFGDYRIADEEIRCLLDQVKCGGKITVSPELETVAEAVSEIYYDETFGPLLREKRLSGDIQTVEVEFDKKVGKNGYRKFMEACDDVGVINCPSYVAEINTGIMKDLVKAYRK